MVNELWSQRRRFTISGSGLYIDSELSPVTAVMNSIQSSFDEVPPPQTGAALGENSTCCSFQCSIIKGLENHAYIILK